MSNTVLFVGPCRSGKTWLINNIIGSMYPRYLPTLSVRCHTYFLEANQTAVLYDTPGDVSIVNIQSIISNARIIVICLSKKTCQKLKHFENLIAQGAPSNARVILALLQLEDEFDLPVKNMEVFQIKDRQDARQITQIIRETLLPNQNEPQIMEYTDVRPWPSEQRNRRRCRTAVWVTIFVCLLVVAGIVAIVVTNLTGLW